MDFHRVACFKSLQRDNRQMLEQGEVFAATWPAVLSAAGERGGVLRGGSSRPAGPAPRAPGPPDLGLFSV